MICMHRTSHTAHSVQVFVGVVVCKELAPRISTVGRVVLGQKHSYFKSFLHSYISDPWKRSPQSYTMSETILSGVSPQKNSISKLFYTGNDSKNSPRSPTTELNGNSLSSPSQEAECREICKRLSEDFIYFKLQSNAGRPPCKFTETLRRVGREVEERYAITLNGLVNNLQYDPKKHGAGKELFNVSLNAMFEEGAVNWGRVVMVYVFAARLAKYCEENGNSEYVDEVVEVCGDYVAEKLTPWIMKQGGWDDFNESFKAKDWKEKATFNSLLVTGAVLGGLAALRFLTK